MDAPPRGRTWEALRRIVSIALPHRYHVLAAFAGMALVALTEPAVVWLVKYIVDYGFGDIQDKAGEGLLFIAPVGLVFVFAVRGLAGFGTGYLLLWVSSMVLMRLQRDVYEAVLASDPHIDDVQLGQSINSVAVEGRNALELVERVLIKFFRSLFSVLALAVTLVQIHPLAVGLLSFVIPFVWAVRSVGKRYEAAADEYVVSNSRLAECTEEVLMQAGLVRQSQTCEFEARRLDQIGKRVNLTYRRMLGVAGLMVPLTQVIVAINLAILFWIRPMLAPTLSDGEFVALATTLLLMMVPLRDLAEVNGAMLRGVVAALTVFSVADLPRERTSGLVFNPPAAPEIELAEVSLVYPEHESQTLERIKLTIAAGESVALTGCSGAGKTSILRLIAGLTRATHGSVRVDGMCISQIDLATLRGRIAWVSQRPLLFDDSIGYNVCYGHAAPDVERMWAALDAVGLRDFVVSLPAGPQTRIGRDGMRLSGGQGQLLAVARAFYHDASIVLLDEPSSALDPASEHALTLALARLLSGRTGIVVSHRPLTLALATRVLHIEHGQVRHQAGPTIPAAVQHEGMRSLSAGAHA